MEEHNERILQKPYSEKGILDRKILGIRIRKHCYFFLSIVFACVLNYFLKMILYERSIDYMLEL